MAMVRVFDPPASLMAPPGAESLTPVGSSSVTATVAAPAPLAMPYPVPAFSVTVSEPLRSSVASAMVATVWVSVVWPELRVSVLCTVSPALAKLPTWLVVKLMSRSCWAAPATLMVKVALSPSVSAAAGPWMLTSGWSSSSSMVTLALPEPDTPPSSPAPELAFSVGRAKLTVSPAPSSRASCTAVSTRVALVAVAPLVGPVKVTVGVALPAS